jgi:hypothetical protein
MEAQMEFSAGEYYPATFERIEEYKAILENLAGLSLRRQTTNNVYVGLNTVFLTALGVFTSTHLNLMMWSTAVVVMVITVAILPLNFIWRITLTRYERSAIIRYDYLREIEEEFRARDGTANNRDIGLYLRLKKLGLARFGNTQLERILATYFLAFYPAISLILVALTWLVQNHVLAPLTL